MNRGSINSINDDKRQYKSPLIKVLQTFKTKFETSDTEDEDFEAQGAHALRGRQRNGTKAYHRSERAVIRQS